MSDHLSVSETLALLDTLRGVIRDFSAHEEKLNSDFRVRSGAELRLFDEATAEQTTQASARLGQAEELFQAEKGRCQSRYEKRKARLKQAHNSVRTRAMREVSDQEGQRKYKVQEGTLLAERRRDADLANGVAALDEFNRKLGATRDSFVQLENSARKAFRPYGSFRRLLAYERHWPEPDLSGNENKLLEQLELLQEKTRGDLDKFRRILLPQIFRFLPISLLVLLLGGFAAAFPFLTHTYPRVPVESMISAGALVFVLVLYFVGQGQGSSAAKAIAENLAKARRLHDVALQKSETWYQQEQRRIKDE